MALLLSLCVKLSFLQFGRDGFFLPALNISPAVSAQDWNFSCLLLVKFLLDQCPKNSALECDRSWDGVGLSGLYPLSCSFAPNDIRTITTHEDKEFLYPYRGSKKRG